MKIHHIDEGVGRIVKGVNTTPDVGPNEIKIQAAKFGNKVDKDGRPPTLSKKVKGNSTNVLFNLGMTESEEPRYTAMEWACIEGGHDIDDLYENKSQPKQPGRVFTALENYAHLKGHGTDVPLEKYLYHVTYAEALEGMLEDGHLNTKGPAPFHYADYFSMTADPKYSVAGNPEVQIIIDTARVSKMETFEQHKEDWDDSGKDDGDWESEYRVEETIPLDYVVAVKILKSKATPEIIELAKKRGVKLVGKDTSVTENFADGKKKGKSRPGRIFTALENFADGKKKGTLKEQPWNNQSDTGSLSSKIFQPGDFISNQGDPIWGLWLPLSSSILNKLTPKKQRVTAFHLTGVQNIDNMINLQGKKKSISSFFYMHHSHYDRGVRGGGGVIFELDANLLGAFEQDIMSDPDKSGMRWITLEYLVRAAYEHGEPLTKLYGEMADLLKTLLKKYAPDVTYDSDIDAGNKWTEFGKSLATTKDGKTQNIVIKDYIDGTYSIMLKHAEHVRKALFYYMDNPGSTQDDWDEVVVNEFNIKTAHVLKNTAEDPQNLEKLKQLESKGIPVRVWDSPQELNDYVEKIGMSQKLQENFADGKKKGKSRPGRVKKSGASCNGSVTALRKRAKNASGEKAKMYHWCANMKSGKKKKK